jgi:hypothetical protein
MLPKTVTISTKSNFYDGPGSYWEYRLKSKQAKPYDLPLDYQIARVTVPFARLAGAPYSYSGIADAGQNKGDFIVFSDGRCPCVRTDFDNAVNSVRAKLVGALDEEAMLAVNYAERAQAASMMLARLNQLQRFGRYLRAGRILDAVQALGLDPNRPLRPPKKQKRWRRSKDVANAWLEYHFGWSPLVHDIYNAIHVLQNPIPGGTITVRGPRISLDNNWSTSSGGAVTTREISGWVFGKAGVTLAITNPNAYLANRLGLVNPAAVVWELVPFSFVVDWFVNVSDFINQYSDFVGLTLKDPWYQTTSLQTSTHMYRKGPFDKMDVTRSGFFSTRALGMPGVTLRVRPLKRLSLARAATAVSLLVQFLPKV